MFLFTPTMPACGALFVAGRCQGKVVRRWCRRCASAPFRNALTYLIAFMLYNDGLAAIIAFGGVYASATFGWSTTTLAFFGIILTVFAIPGAFLAAGSTT